jgi:hypothetical protein
MAKDVFTHSAQRDAFSRQEQEKAHATAAAKIARLKALRMARDAETAAKEAAMTAATPAASPTAGKARKPRAKAASK